MYHSCGVCLVDFLDRAGRF